MAHKNIQNFIILVSISSAIIGCKKPSNSDENLDEKSIKNENAKILSIKWNSCDKTIEDHKLKIKKTVKFECGKMDVPLNWDNPNGENITLSLLRSKATDPQNRIGSLIVNPGGPGGSSLNLAKDLYNINALQSKFDIIGVDPRGVGESTPIKCPISSSFDITFPNNEAEFQSVLQSSQKLYESCLKETGEFINHIDTVSVAHDIEAVRKALNEEKLNFWGFSYGTYIASKYAELYPNNSRALVLDSVTDYSQSLLEHLKTNAKEAHKVLNEFVNYNKNNPSSELHNKDIIKIILDTKTKLNQNPIKYTNPSTNVKEDFTGDIFLISIYQLLYLNEKDWLNIAQAIHKLQNNDLKTLINLVEQNSSDINISQTITVNCLDYPSSSIQTWSEYSSIMEEFKKESPIFGKNIASWFFLNKCLGWKNIKNISAKPLNIKIKQPVLIVSTANDIATPLKWAEFVKLQIPGSFLLYYEGSGHGAYNSDVSGCIYHVVNNFFLEKKLPSENSYCLKSKF